MRHAKTLAFAFALALVAFGTMPQNGFSSATMVDTDGDGGYDKAYVTKDADTGNIVAI
jgi:hypothetical protein